MSLTSNIWRQEIQVKIPIAVPNINIAIKFWQH